MHPQRSSSAAAFIVGQDPKVEICFFNGASELPDARMMRVSGEVQFVEDEGLTHRVAQERAVLEDTIGQPLEPLTEVFRLRSGAAWFWRLADVLRESDAARIEF